MRAPPPDARGCLFHLAGSALLAIALLAAALLRLSRVARPESTAVARISAENSLVEVRALSLRRPGSRSPRALGWSLVCAGTQLAAGTDSPPTQLLREESPHGVRVYACRARGPSELRADTGCIAVDPAQCRLVNPSR